MALIDIINGKAVDQIQECLQDINKADNEEKINLVMLFKLFLQGINYAFYDEGYLFELMPGTKEDNTLLYKVAVLKFNVPQDSCRGFQHLFDIFANYILEK